jgi:hypothetical protein
MTDIEVKRKELETAKRIRDNEYDCIAPEAYVPCDKCPVRIGCDCNPTGKGMMIAVDAFIATREAELAALDKAQKPEPLYPRAKGATGPALDDFALALIQGGYFNMTMGEDAAIMNLISRAGKIKDAFDARRND